MTLKVRPKEGWRIGKSKRGHFIQKAVKKAPHTAVIAVVLGTLVAIGACGTETASTPTVVSRATPMPSPTALGAAATPIPSPTALEATPTPIPSPTPTLAPTPSPTPIPSPTPSPTPAPVAYEVWVIDQADSAQGGNKLYIYPSASFAETVASRAPEVIDLEAAAKGVGDGPGVRPRSLVFNSGSTHGIVANSDSGHVYFIRAADRKLASSVKAGGQAHGAVPSPDDSLVLVTNRNGKRLARITTDFKAERFAYNPADDLDLKALEDAGHPDNSPVCSVVFAGGSKKAYVALSGGGLFVVDAGATPMKVLKSFTRDEIAPVGCGGAALGTKMYIASGTATSSNLYVFDTTTDSLIKTITFTSLGTDAHGLVVTKNGKFAWVANRGERDNIVVVDTAQDVVAGTIEEVGAAPDFMGVSPDGDLIFVSLRGPMNLTGGPSAKGVTPGLAVIQVLQDGKTGARQMVVPIGDQSATSPVDPHALAVRLKAS